MFLTETAPKVSKDPTKNSDEIDKKRPKAGENSSANAKDESEDSETDEETQLEAEVAKKPEVKATPKKEVNTGNKEEQTGGEKKIDFEAMMNDFLMWLNCVLGS